MLSNNGNRVEHRLGGIPYRRRRTLGMTVFDSKRDDLEMPMSGVQSFRRRGVLFNF